MCRCLLIAFLAICLTGASPLTGPQVPASVSEARDTEHEESTVATNTALPTGELGPEVPDMLSGVTVNNTFMHKVDSDNDEPGIIAAPIPELSTAQSEPDHTTNLTDKVNDPRVLDPGTTHQEDTNTNSSAILSTVNNTKAESKNSNETTPKSTIDDSIAVPEAPLVNETAKTSKSAPTDVSTILPHAKDKKEQVTSKPELKVTKQKVENATLSPTAPIRAEGVAANTSTTKAPGTTVHNEDKPQLPRSGQVEVFSPSMGNETQNLLVGFQPQTSEQHADHLQLSSASDPSFLQPSQSAAILAGVFIVVALLGYVGLLVWRRLLEKKYGNREMLVNEDEFYDTSDLRHFEL